MLVLYSTAAIAPPCLGGLSVYFAVKVDEMLRHKLGFSHTNETSRSARVLRLKCCCFSPVIRHLTFRFGFREGEIESHVYIVAVRYVLSFELPLKGYLKDILVSEFPL